MNPSSNLFLIGPMGAGKTSIGRRLAKSLGLAFLDLDAGIEERTGASVTTIFEIEGEAGFRRRESDLLAEFAMREGIVLATGGGAVLADDNRALLRERGFVLWLNASVDEQLRRLSRDRTRPLLETPDRQQRLQQLAVERNPIYRGLADLEVASSGGESCGKASARIASLLQRNWQQSPTTMSSP